ncbi:hypothetical protein HYH03_001953 [Edaphochlamys debaryana]|uniref:BTB domain-containing protein n=1 Tax=Edaphochlamys debaryana TaxID=47281 RepID=A0A836C5Z4_9CHLO|nr:hypothetical protein HYH03_001953 [Edaphochlamys debaryana]|eukprot:KAG2500379.1 hypothetical protein HYH03_001953 [Edaphochlamys debaryana]
MILKGTFDFVKAPWGLTTRLRPGPNGELQPETLVLTEEGSFYPLLGASSRGELSLGPALEFFEKDAGGVRRPFRGPRFTQFLDPVFVLSTLSVFFCCGHAVYRLHGDNTVELVAGHPEEEGDSDGLGPAARLSTPLYWCSGGEGSVHCRSGAEGIRIRRLELPAAWLAEGATGTAAGEAAGAGVGEQRVREADGRGAGAAAAPVLLAGREGVRGTADGRGEEASFEDIFSLTVDAGGNIIVADIPQDTTVVRRVAPDGTVTTLARLEEGLHRPAILPNGYLALCNCNEPSLLVLDLGLNPPPLLPPAPAGPPRRTLHADMGALLDAQPDGTAGLTLVVGGRRFPVHRAVLIARCDYFRSQLEGGFADGVAAELSLPDADPAAFELLLRFVYTGAVDMPSALALAVAELADRLLLPELCSDAQAVVLSGVSAETVVGDLLRAVRLGASFSGVLSSLKAWYLEHHDEVHTGAPASLERLAESPRLMAELLMGAFSVRPSAKRQRTG